MSHYTTGTGRPYVECDDPMRHHAGGPLLRCQRRSYGTRERFGTGPQLDLFDLPRGWAVAPYPDDFEHGATRRNLLDGGTVEPLLWLVGITGDLHTCPTCRVSRQGR
ncbi:hypothetical protein JOE61_003874 [Nocardioides salarius]|uniref:Uncharacterized protein n=1 Tax=Nocardioides salarius TaxID=374513 RepID=A0ABS2MFX3_9ACTN|nr:hypothetical protein [Nocardioides salarius]MBM7510060.1 hypothetical protein [Nocardioides salarius]